VSLLTIKLGNLDPVDLESSVFSFPGRIPLAFVVVKSVRGMRVLIIPWFATDSIGEVGVSTANSKIKN